MVESLLTSVACLLHPKFKERVGATGSSERTNLAGLSL